MGHLLDGAVLHGSKVTTDYLQVTRHVSAWWLCGCSPPALCSRLYIFPLVNEELSVKNVWVYGTEMKYRNSARLFITSGNI